MPHADVYAAFLREHSEKARHLVKIVERLSHAHEHQRRYPDAPVLLRRFNLGHHFGGGQVSPQAAHPGGAERAAHAAADLGGQTLRPAVMILHQHRFHRFAVGQAIEIFYRPIQPGYQTTSDDDMGNVINSGQLLPQGPRQIGHKGKIRNAFIQPGADLARPESGLSPFPHLRPQRFLRHCADIQPLQRVTSISQSWR